MAGPATLYQAGVHGSRPANGSGCVLYSCTTHNLVYRDDGTSWTTFMTLVGGAGGDIATDTIWDAAGDLVQGTGANTAAKLSAGLAGQALISAGAAAANAWKYPPGYEFDYVQITSPVSLTATTEATANTIVTGNAVTYDGSTIVMIEFWFPYLTAPAADTNTQFVLYDGSSSIGRMGLLTTPAGTTNTTRAPDPTGSRRLTPSNASHTYSIRGFVGSGTASVGAGAGGSTNDMPGYVRITKV